MGRFRTLVSSAFVAVLVATGVQVPSTAEATPTVASQPEPRQPHVEPTPPAPENAIPRQERIPTGAVAPEAKRLNERVEARTETTKSFQLADGRTQVEVSAAPVHYRDASGKWQDIDTRIGTVDARSGFAFASEKGLYRAQFGMSTDQMARFAVGDRSVELGLAGPQRTVQPAVEGSAITYPDAAGEADVAYAVTSTALKEKIVLDKTPQAAVYTFTLRVSGVDPRPQSDGSIAFVRAGDGDGGAVFTMPKPFMYDSRDDATSPYGKSFSDKVTQTLKKDGDRYTITVAADDGWLRAKDRKFPVVIDPTIKIQPTPTQSQDVMINSDQPTTNFDGNWRLSVGTTTSSIARSLLKFDLSGVPVGTQLDSAQLQTYYDQDHTTGANDVAIEARRVTTPWVENTVTWNSINTAVGELGVNVEQVDNADTGKTAVNGEWPVVNTGDATHAVGGTYRMNRNARTGEAFTWVPRLTEPGDYQVEAHYIAAGDRATNAPYTVSHAGGEQKVLINQSTGANGIWQPLGTWSFNAGTSHKITLGDVADKAVIADAVRLTKPGVQVKKANMANVWHSFSVRSIAQDWLNGTQPNHGLMLKAADETLGKGGPRYEAAEIAYGGERANTPKLLLTYGRPGVALNAPTTIRATGADLTWSAYRDPSSDPGDDLVEYQLHRSIYQNFQPSAATLVAPIKADKTGYKDTTATPTAADDPQPFGNAFYYILAAKTRDGQVIPSQTQLVRLPKAGRVVKVIQGDTPDTTLTAKQPDTGHDQLTGEPWLMAGNSSGTFGASRPVVKFGNLGIPAGAKVVDTELGLWGITTVIGGAVGTETYALHGLTKDFDETATWNKAGGSAWATPGGDFDPVVAASLTKVTNDPTWRTWKPNDLVQKWVNDPASNKGALVKLGNEATATERTLFLSSEAAEPELRPRLIVTYTEQTAENTYYAPTTPDRMIPGDEYTVPVTITNTTGAPWPKSDWVLSYHWALPDGSDYTNPGNRAETPLKADVPVDGVSTLDAKVKAAIPVDLGNKRESFILKWDLRNIKTGKWLSETTKVPPLSQNITVEDPTSNQLGLEKFYQYSGVDAGAGSTVMVNQFAGNAVWGYNAYSHPSRGPSTFLRMSYNSQDTSNSYIGYGWSLSTSTTMRLGSPLEFYGSGGSGFPQKVFLADGDGTRHQFELNKHNSANPADWDYDNPAGVHAYLQRSGGDDSTRVWVMTRPDRTQFFFDVDGYQTATVDKNGNELTFTYERSYVSNRNTGVLRYITDATGRRTLNLEYYAHGDPDYDFYTGDKKQHGINLTNGKITNQLKAISDLTGRRVEFVYSDRGLLQEMTDGAGTDQPKRFTFFYDNTWLDKNPKLLSATDPRGNSTGLTYHDTPGKKWKIAALTDRKQKKTGFDYRDPDGDIGSFIESTVTDARNNTSTALIDGYGRPTKLTNAKNEVTELTWDADNNVRRLQENNKAAATWVYDPLTGFPTEIKDAEANAVNGPATVLTYHTGLKGHVADLETKTSPEGRKWQFTYNGKGNLVAVTDPKGTSTPAQNDYTSTYAYDDVGQLITATDANDNATQYRGYDATGYPTQTIDPYNRSSYAKYDPLGNVLETKDAKAKVSTFTYDTYSRPLTSKLPKDVDKGEYIFTSGAQYDANDNVIKYTAADNIISEARYNALDQIEAAIAPKDTPDGPVKTTQYRYDDAGNLISVTDPKGALTSDPNDFVTTYEYDPLNRVIASVDAKKNRGSYNYDDVGNIVTTVDPIKNSTPDPNDFTAKFGYDRNHQVSIATDAAGFVSGRRYDRDGLVIASTTPPANAGDTDPALSTKLIKYDARGALEEQWQPQKKDASGNLIYRKTRLEYDEVGNAVKAISPRGMDTSDDPDDFAQISVYDKLNRVIEQWTPFDKDDARVNTPDKTLTSYDEVGNVTEVSAPPSAGQTVRNVTRNTHYDTGWIRTSVDSWNITTGFTYDNFGRQLTRTLTTAGAAKPGDPGSRSMAWSYYPDGKVKTRSDDGVPVGRDTMVIDNSDPAAVVTGNWRVAGSAADHEGFDYRTHDPGTGTDTVAWNIDAPRNGMYELFVRYTATATAKNAIYIIDHDGGTTSKSIDQTQQTGQWVSLGKYGFTEDQACKVTLSDKADGVVVADAVKLVRDGTGETDREQKTFGYAYDPNGNRTSMTDTSPGAAVDTYTLGYTPLNQVEKIEEKLNGVVKRATGYSYDPNGNTKTLTHNTQNSAYEYDARDLLAKVTNSGTAPGSKPQVTTFTYTPRSQKLLQTKANGNTVDHQYFPDSSPRHTLERNQAGAVVAEHTLDYDANGQVTRNASRTMNADNHAASLDFIHTYTFDPRDRIRKSVKSDPSGKELEVETYAHDANSNVIEQTVDGQTTKFTYDRNRLITAAGQVTATSTYDPYGRLDKVVAAGKLIEKYRYDGFDRVAEHQKLKEGSVTDRVTTKFTYDPIDRTAVKNEDGKNTDFTYLGLSQEVLTEELAGKVDKSYQYSPTGERLSQTKYSTDGGAEDTFYSYSPHADVETITDTKGETKATYGYTAYGKDDKESFTGIDKPDPVNPTKDLYNPYRYSAKRFDHRTGTYDMGFRDYSPNRNTFLTRDNYNGALNDLNLGADPYTNNRYAFTGGNPITRIELDGHINCGPDNVGCGGIQGDPKPSQESKASWWESQRKEPQEDPNQGILPGGTTYDVTNKDSAYINDQMLPPQSEYGGPDPMQMAIKVDELLSSRYPGGIVQQHVAHQTFLAIKDICESNPDLCPKDYRIAIAQRMAFEGEMSSPLGAGGLRALGKWRNDLRLPSPGKGVPTLGRLDIGGQSFYGISSHGTKIDFKVNAISRTHAEADAFQQAKNANVQAKSAVWYVDYPTGLCKSCGQFGGLRSMARQLGLEQVTVVYPGGVIHMPVR